MDMKGRRFVVTVTVEEAKDWVGSQVSDLFVHRRVLSGSDTYRITEDEFGYMANKLVRCGLRDVLGAAGQWPPEDER